MSTSDSRKAITSCFVTFSISAMRFDIDRGLLPDSRRCAARDLPGPFERRAGLQFDLQPDLVLMFQSQMAFIWGRV